MVRDDLGPDQQRVLADWFPGGTELVRDLGWGLVDTVVRHLRTAEGDVVVKAGGEGDAHIGREIDGYRVAGPVWTERDLAPRLLHHDRDARLIVTSLVPGTLADAGPARLDPDVHRQAGAALALLHRHTGRRDDDFEARQHRRCRGLLAAPHQVPADQVERIAARLDAYRPPTTTVVPTHGDFSPRNWLVDDDGRVRVIDLGRFEHRPRSSDLCRLHHRQWRGRPDLAEAFVEGYGDDPRADDVWEAQLLREALGTVTWALAVGDAAFEAEGRRMVDDLVGPSRTG